MKTSTDPETKQGETSPELFIVNVFDRPCERLLAERRDDGKFYYVHPEMRDVERHWGMKPAAPTPLERFGIKVVVRGGILHGRKVAESEAGYGDGRLRPWQGLTEFSFTWPYGTREGERVVNLPEPPDEWKSTSPFTWPAIFADAALVATRDPRALCADALEAWAACAIGEEPPKSFGDVIVKVADRLGMKGAPTVKNLIEHSRAQGWSGEEATAEPVAADGYSEPVTFTGTGRFGSVPEGEDDVYTVEEFRTFCRDGLFIDSDGFGCPVRDGKSNPSFTLYPSEVSKVPADATHVVWFNK